MFHLTNNKQLMNLIRVAGLAAMAAIPGFSCSYSVSAPAVGAGGGVAYVTVNTQPGCPWRVQHNGSFLSVYANITGSGPGTAMLYAQPDRGAARSATVTVLQPVAGPCDLGGRSCIPTTVYVSKATTTLVQY